MRLAVCYYPEQWDKSIWQQDARHMMAMGIRLVRIGEFGWCLMEPAEGVYVWQWLDEAIDILGRAGLEVILGTPTAAPPKWLVDKHPEILPYDSNGKQLKFGSRRHYTFASEIYKQYCAKIVTKMAQRYGDNPFVKGWQIDNEYGDHDTVLSYGDADRIAFRQWLHHKYKHIDRLNRAWGTVFWSMCYTTFEHIDLPNEGTEQPTPSALLDFHRFSSDNVVAFNKRQVDIFRTYAPNQYLIHNYMSGMSDFDPYRLGKDLDVAAFDSYPLGGVVHGWQDDRHKSRYMRQGTPDLLSFYHHIYRRVGNGKLWIMEQQPGPVNWAKYNPAPVDGMVYAWTMEAFANGAEVVCYFRWRQCRFAQEQYHAGLHLPNGDMDQGGIEAQQAFADIQKLPVMPKQPGEVALIMEYESLWAISALPQGENFKNPIRYVFEQYTALRQLGVAVDIIPSTDDISPYKAVCVASMAIDKPAFSEKLQQFTGVVLIMPRTASKTADMWIPETLPIGSLQSLIDVTVTRVESLPPYHSEVVQWGDNTYRVQGWRESITTTATPVATFATEYRNGYPALVQQGNILYCACLPSADMMCHMMQYICHMAHIETTDPLGDVRLIKRGRLTFAINYGVDPATVHIPDAAEVLIGTRHIPVAGVTVWHL